MKTVVVRRIGRDDCINHPTRTKGTSGLNFPSCIYTSIQLVFGFSITTNICTITFSFRLY